MAIKITINNVTANGDSKLLCDSIIRSSDAEIIVNDMITSDGSRVLNDLNIDEVRDNIYRQFIEMDKQSPEYSFIQRLLNENKPSFKSKISDHVKKFTEGVVANVITNLLTK